MQPQLRTTPAEKQSNALASSRKADARRRGNRSDYYAAYNRERGDTWKARAGTPEYKARQAVARAVKSGRLVRPDFCSRCDVSCKPEGHHHDYSKPLEVEWLCDDCHEDKHRKVA